MVMIMYMCMVARRWTRVFVHMFTCTYMITWRHNNMARAGMESLLQNLFISAPTLSQIAAVAAFDCEDELEAHVQRYKRNMEVRVV